MIKKDKNKKYIDYEKTKPEQLDLFSLNNIFLDKREPYSGTVELYDLVPKYFHDDVEKFRKDGKYLDILSRDFVYRKQNMKLNMTPAYLLQKDGSTKAFFPSQREEIIEDVLRKLATDSNRNEFLDDRLSVRFTLYELWKELRKVKHTFSYDEIRESLEIMSKTNIEIKSEDKKISFSSNMFETFGRVDGNEGGALDNTEEYSKGIVYFIRFNSLVSESIKNKTWRIINYDQCMAYRKVISRWLHKRISHMFITGNIKSPYNIMLSTVIRDSGMTQYKNISMNIVQVENCLNEMINIGSIDKYEMEKVFFEGKKNKIEDVKFLLWVSKIFFEDIQLGFLAVRDDKEIKEIQNNIQSNKNGNADSLQTQDKQLKNEMLQKVISLMESEQLSLRTSDVEKLLACLVFDENMKENIILNAKACIEYIRNQEKKGEKYKTIAIFTRAIENNWQPNGKEEKTDLLSISENIELKNKREKEKSGVINCDDSKYIAITDKLKEIYGDRVFKNNFSKREMAISFVEDKIILFFRWDFVFNNVNRDYVQTKDIDKNIIEIIKKLYPNIKDVSLILDSGIQNYFK